MYKGYGLKLSVWFVQSRVLATYGKSVEQMHSFGQSEYKQVVEAAKAGIAGLSPYDSKDNIDGNQIETSWFPKRRCHVFLSHSHKDEDLAVSIAGTLKYLMGLDVFVDSLVWGFRDDLINQLLNRLHIPGEEKDYRYRQVIAHVDCMLNKSLIEMEDECECLLFLNTPNSVSTYGIVQRTNSPWIYSELETSRFLRVHMDDRRTKIKLANEAMGSAVTNSRFGAISYAVPNHLLDLSGEAFARWCVSCCREGRKSFDALDKLYSISR